MANEITFISGLSAIKSNLNLATPTESLRATMTGDRADRRTQAVGTTYEAIAVGDISSAGWARFKNLDGTNYVEIGLEVAAAFYGFVKLLPGETSGPMRLSTLSIFGRANTAGVNLEVMLIEN